VIKRGGLRHVFLFTFYTVIIVRYPKIALQYSDLYIYPANQNVLLNIDDNIDDIFSTLEPLTLGEMTEEMKCKLLHVSSETLNVYIHCTLYINQDPCLI
jgi:hypothetical protein